MALAKAYKFAEFSEEVLHDQRIEELFDVLLGHKLPMEGPKSSVDRENPRLQKSRVLSIKQMSDWDHIMNLGFTWTQLQRFVATWEYVHVRYLWIRRSHLQGDNTMRHLCSFGELHFYTTTRLCSNLEWLGDQLRPLVKLFSQHPGDFRKCEAHISASPYSLFREFGITLNSISLDHCKDISTNLSMWIANHVEEVTMWECAFEDGGKTLCRNMVDKNSTVKTFNLHDTYIDAGYLAMAFRNSTSLEAATIYGTGLSYRDDCWDTLIKGVADSSHLKNIRLSGHCSTTRQWCNGLNTLLLSRSISSITYFLTTKAVYQPGGLPWQLSVEERVGLVNAIRSNPRVSSLVIDPFEYDVKCWSDCIVPILASRCTDTQLSNFPRTLPSIANDNAPMCGKVLSHHCVRKDPAFLFKTFQSTDNLWEDPWHMRAMVAAGMSPEEIECL